MFNINFNNYIVLKPIKTHDKIVKTKECPEEMVG